MEPGKAIEQAVHPLLKSLGFRKAGRTWRAKRPESILVLHVQRSQYGPQFYLNCGVYFRALGESDTPPSHQCHIQTRVESLAGENPELKRALNFEVSVAEEERLAVITSAIEQFALPWFGARESEAKARSALSGSSSNKDLTMKVVREHLGLEGAV